MPGVVRLYLSVPTEIRIPTHPLGFIQSLDPPVRVKIVDYAQWHKAVSQEPVEKHQSFDDMFKSIQFEREKLPTSAPVLSPSMEWER